MNLKEYKERKEAQSYFRENNDMFLSSGQWVKTIAAGLLGAILLGIVLAAITIATERSFSILYIVIGLAIGNIMTSVSGVSSKQMGIVSAIITLCSFYFSHLASLLYVFNLLYTLDASFVGTCMVLAFESMFQSGILEIVFIVVGAFSAYQQAS